MGGDGSIAGQPQQLQSDTYGQPPRTLAGGTGFARADGTDGLGVAGVAVRGGDRQGVRRGRGKGGEDESFGLWSALSPGHVRCIVGLQFVVVAVAVGVVCG